MKWNCTGVAERIEQVKSFLATSRKADKSFIAYQALKELDRNITVLMQDEENDQRWLLTYRRRVRTLQREVLAAI